MLQFLLPQLLCPQCDFSIKPSIVSHLHADEWVKRGNLPPGENYVLESGNSCAVLVETA